MDITIDLNGYTKEDAFYNRIAARALIKRGNKYLMVQGVKGDLKFPGGGMEDGETLVDTLFREVLEETGHYVKKETAVEVGTASEIRTCENETLKVMDSHYFTCEVEDFCNLREYGAYFVSLDEALRINSMIKDYEACPWILRDTKVMELLLGNDVKINIYDDFACLGGACDFTCCKTWKIAVDEETHDIWQKDKLPECTRFVDDARVIALNEKGFCPHFTNDGLCDLVIKHGDDYISKTCREFPRQINIFDDRKEYSIVSCCPHVVDMLNEADEINYRRYNSKEYFEKRDKIVDFFANKGNSIRDAALLAFYYLNSKDFDEQELKNALADIKGNDVDTFMECNELFLDISVNYVKEGMYKEFLEPLYMLGEDLCDKGINKNDIREFNSEFEKYEALIRKYIISELFANLYLPEYDLEAMTVAFEWIMMEYVTIKQGCFLLWKNSGTLLYNDIRLCITVISRMTGYDSDDIREYMVNSFESVIFDPAYLLLILGGH